MQFKCAEKSDKAKIKHFYKQQNFSASFKGYDYPLLVINNDEIIAACIVSRITSDNPQCLLHGLVVDENYRRSQLATQIIIKLTERHAFMYCFAEASLSPLYLKCGATIAQKAELSKELTTLYNAYLTRTPSLTIFKLS